MQVADEDGGVEGGLPGGDAFGLEFLELAEGFLEGPLQTLFVEAEVDEGFGVLAEYACGGQGGEDFGMIGLESTSVLRNDRARACCLRWSGRG